MEVIHKETTAEDMRGGGRGCGEEHKEERRELGSEQGLKDTLRSCLLAEEKGRAKCTKEGQPEKKRTKNCHQV